MTREEVAAELADLLRRSGYQRLEALHGPGGRVNGWCVDADRHGFHLVEIDQSRDPGVPGR